MSLDLTHYLTVSMLEDPAILVGYALLLDIATRILCPIARDRFKVMGGVFDGLARFFNNKLNRDFRGEAALRRRGTVSLVIVGVIAYVVGYGVEHLITTHNNGTILAVLVLFFCMSATRPISVGWQLFSHLKQKAGKPSSATQSIFSRYLLSERFASTTKPDHYRYARFYVEHCVETLCLSLLSPMFWFLMPYLFGYSGWIPMIMSIALNRCLFIWSPTLSMPPFARSALIVTNIINLIPARIGAVFIWVSAFFTPEASPAKAISTITKQSRAYRNIALSWPVALMTGALNVVIEAGRGEWVGPDKASAKLTWIDVRRTLIFYVINLIVTLLILFGVIYLSLGYGALI